MKSKTVFYCTECGNEFPRWTGQCTACGSWNTVVEQPAVQKTGSKSEALKAGIRRIPKLLSELDSEEELRFSTGIDELDRVLGGGAVKGSLVLFGGAPGVGKSTLLLQICEHICETQSVLYVTGEESEHQLKMRAERLGVRNGTLLVLSETNMDDILSAIEDVKPDTLIIDSIQTLYSPELTSGAGSVAQVKECTNALMKIAKTYGVTVFVIGHVNKEGAIAGPKACCISRAFRPPITEYSIPQKTDSAQQTRSAFLKWTTLDFTAYLIPPKCCFSEGRKKPREPA